MTKTSFLCLCDILRPYLTRENTRFRSTFPVEVRVGVCLWRLATNLEFRSISHLFGVGISTACTITQHIVTAINRVMRPLERWKLPQVAGAIDGTHIGIIAPAEDPADYYNRKHFYSVILQAVVDHRMQFWDINVGWPGKVHDARVLANSSLYRRGENGTLFPGWIERLNNVDVPVHILGDAAYPLLPWLLKPYPVGRGLTEAQTHFNFRLSQGRMTVEWAFGRLKGRWRCLLKRCDVHISFVNQIISACCILHNYCEIANEEWEDEDIVDDVDDLVDPEIGHQAICGQIRDALCEYLAQ
uniref:DDE Tnp4 domain-containing protein n=1 Tax=Periophthalmus magnuspinnatus TaxID=409849 RepID=A0A3B4B831_9GOBI